MGRGAARGTPVPVRKKGPIYDFLLSRALPPLAHRVYHDLGRSSRYLTENEGILRQALAAGRPIVGAFLPARRFQLLPYFCQPERGRWILMCSHGSDGDLMASVERNLGYRVARGSSGDGGARALVEMIKAQREDRGLHSCLAVDGAHGPRGIVRPGVLTLAHKVNGLLLPVAASTPSAWIVKRSWDRTVMPKPCAQISIHISEPLELPVHFDADNVEALRVRLQDRLLKIQASSTPARALRTFSPCRSQLPEDVLPIEVPPVRESGDIA